MSDQQEQNAKKLLVTGGSGFIGSEICRIAVEEGHDVVSVSEHGRPAFDAPWIDKVAWIEADVLEPETWRDQLTDCHAVIHCVDTLREDAKSGRTYERINRDAATTVAWETEHAGVRHFVFVSSETKPPFVSNRYLDAKRTAETAIRGHDYHETILRPAYVYGPGRPASSAIARLLESSASLPGMEGYRNGHRPLHVDQVATAAVRAATEEGYEGTVGVDLIQYLAEDRWKNYTDGAARPARGGWVAAAAVAGLVGLAAGVLFSRRD